ncbi:MAG TPA: PqqD family protein [Pyrinomonadaceae bacterium]|nr:PqqD family protein [Pyrinomonadaceae bacterium]
MTNLPRMRMNDLVVQELDQEVLIYDLKNNKAYCLNSVSAEIWKKCDGLTTVQEVAEMIGKQMNIKLDEDFVWLAIADLEKNKLLIGEVKRPSEFEKLSRRKVLFKYALPTLVLPLISSIVAPTSINAQSSTACPAIPPGCSGSIPGGIPTGCPCTLNCSNCLPGACNLGTMMCV